MKFIVHQAALLRKIKVTARELAVIGGNYLVLCSSLPPPTSLSCKIAQWNLRNFKIFRRYWQSSAPPPSSLGVARTICHSRCPSLQIFQTHPAWVSQWALLRSGEFVLSRSDGVTGCVGSGVSVNTDWHWPGWLSPVAPASQHTHRPPPESPETAGHTPPLPTRPGSDWSQVWPNIY